MKQGTAVATAPNLPDEVRNGLRSYGEFCADAALSIMDPATNGADTAHVIAQRNRVKEQLEISIHRYAMRQARLTAGLLTEYVEEIAENVNEANELRPGLPVATRLARILCNVGNIRGHIRALGGGQ